jgi:preprotein translocase subunit YajC
MNRTRLSYLSAATVLLSTGLLHAEAAAPQQGAAGNPLGSFIPLIAIFVIFYFFLIRPQQKRVKEHQKMVNALKKDDKVLTSGGIYGVVVSVKGEIVETKIADNVRVQVAKSAITAVLPPESKVEVPEIVK